MPVSGSSDGCVYVWEGVSGDARIKLDNGGAGVVRMVCHPTQPIIYTCGTDGAVRVFDARLGNCIKTFTGHTDMALDVTISKTGDVVLSSSDDKTCKVYKL